MISSKEKNEKLFAMAMEQAEEFHKYIIRSMTEGCQPEGIASMVTAYKTMLEFIEQQL